MDDDKQLTIFDALDDLNNEKRVVSTWNREEKWILFGLFFLFVAWIFLISTADVFAEECKETEYCSVIEKSDPPVFYGIESFISPAGGFNTTTLKDYESCDCTEWRIVGLAFACDKWECFSTHDVIVPATTTYVYATITNPYITASTSVSVGTTTAYIKEPFGVYPYYSATITDGTTTLLIDKSWTFGELFLGFWLVVLSVIIPVYLVFRFFYPNKVKIQRNND